MKYTEVIGEIYKHTREKKGYFKETVIKDLIGIKIINRFEDEEILPDFLMIERLYQRIGESSDIFTIMMTSEEYDYCIWRENLIEKSYPAKYVNPTGKADLQKTGPSMNFYRNSSCNSGKAMMIVMRNL